MLFRAGRKQETISAKVAKGCGVQCCTVLQRGEKSHQQLALLVRKVTENRSLKAISVEKYVGATSLHEI